MTCHLVKKVSATNASKGDDLKAHNLGVAKSLENIEKCKVVGSNLAPQMKEMITKTN